MLLIDYTRFVSDTTQCKQLREQIQCHIHVLLDDAVKKLCDFRYDVCSTMIGDVHTMIKILQKRIQVFCGSQTLH